MIQNQRSTDYNWSTLCTNKWFPLKHGSQATEHSNEKNYTNYKKKILKNTERGTNSEPAVSSILQANIRILLFSTCCSKWNEHKKNSKHADIDGNTYRHISRHEYKKKRKNQNENNAIHLHQRKHLHNSIKYPNFFESTLQCVTTLRLFKQQLIWYWLRWNGNERTNEQTNYRKERPNNNKCRTSITTIIIQRCHYDGFRLVAVHVTELSNNFSFKITSSLSYRHHVVRNIQAYMHLNDK